LSAGHFNRDADRAILSYFMKNSDSAPAGFNRVDKKEGLCFYNRRPMAADACRVLFSGNSLTCHGPMAGVRAHYGGMAASVPEGDFVHGFVHLLNPELKPRSVEPLINAAGTMRELLAGAEDLIGPPPDIVVIQGGENEPWDAAFPAAYETYVTALAARCAPGGRVLVLDDWYSAEKSACGREIAQRHSWTWINLHALRLVPAHTGDAGHFRHDGVASHPNDAGMAAIAHELISSWRQPLPAKNQAP
jgi:hypothetical protein